MTTPSEPLAGQAVPPNSDQTRELLQFLREQNDANRSTVRDDSEANRKLLLDTVKIVSLPLTVLLVIATFLGFKSLSDLKQTIQAEARHETQTEITRMQGEVRAKISAEFQDSKLETTIKDAAKESTKEAAEPLIKSEVATQVKSTVDAARSTIVAAVAQQTQAVVKQMDSEIDGLVRKDVAAKIAADVNPIIDRIKTDADVQLLITRMNADDAEAYDSLSKMLASAEPSRHKVITAALRTTYAAHNMGMYQSRGFTSPQTDDQLISHLSDDDAYGREAALNGIEQKINLSLLPRAITMMRSDPSINARCAAYRLFNSWTKQSFECLDIGTASRWWEANKQNFQPAR